MKLNESVVVLALATQRDGQTQFFHASLILDAANGPALIDTGLPGQHEVVATALAGAGVGVADLTRIILTHQDIDHIGSLHGLAEASGARVLAGADEVQYIDGTQPARFMTPEALEKHPQLRPVASMFQATHVDEALDDGALIDLAGGVRVVFSPGHTPGHICLFHEPSRTLIAGDALTAQDGQLHGPNPGATLDMAQASQSVQKLAALGPQAIICYHGGVVDADAGAQLRRVAQELAQ